MGNNSIDLQSFTLSSFYLQKSSGIGFTKPLFPSMRHFINVIVPVFTTLSIANNIAILVLLTGPACLRLRLRGPLSVQLYYEFIACADLCSLTVPLYFLIGKF